MGNFIDLTGQIFGKWKVIGLSETIKAGGARYWICECQCENKTIKEVSGVSLRQGKSKSCGCLSKEKKPPIDLTGKIFNRLTVIKVAKERTKNGKILWECQCECGNSCKRSTTALLNKDKFHSCGCYNIEKISSKNPDLTNKIFGYLRVIKLTNEIDNSHNRLWECQCQCGKIIKVRTGSLTTGNTNSCGCTNRSIGEKNIEEILKFNNITFKAQYTNEELNKKRYDFAILQNDNIIRLIEFDGIQHFKKANPLWEEKESFEERQKRDKEKNQWAKEHNIPLVRIPYWERDKITLEMIMGDRYLVKEEEKE